MAENIKQLSNAFSLGAGLNINSNQPIDSRFKVQTLVELTYDWKNKNNGGDILKYEGLLTFVESEGKTFRYRIGASYTSGETTIANWELVPVTADDINSLVEIPEVDIQSISVNGETVTPVDGNVNIIIPDVVHPEYTLETGDTNSVKLVKDGESVGEVSISLTADVVTTTEENTEKVTALSLATEKNIGKIILVKTAEGDYLAGTYIIDGVGSVKYLATTTGNKDDGDVDDKINSAIDSLDSSISAESGFLTGITIENGKLVGYTSDTITIPEVHVPEYIIKQNHSDESKKTTYTLLKDGGAIVGSDVIEVNDSLIVNQTEEGDIIIADKHVLVTSDLDDYKIKDVKADDKILSVDTNGDLSSTISIAHVKSEDGTKNEIVLRGIDGVQIGEAIDASGFVVDGFLDSVSYDSTTHELVFVFNEYHEGVDGQQEVRVDLTAYIDNHTFNVVNGSWTSITITPTVSEDGTETVFNLTIDDSALTTKLKSMEGEIADNSDQIGDVISMVEAIKQCTSGTISAATSDAGEGEVSVVSNAQVDLSGDGSSLTGSFTAVNVVTKQYVTEVETALDERITKLENAEDADTKCESATINAGTTSELTEGEVAVLSNTTITLSGDGTSLTGTATAVNVVTKQYVTGIETALDERITALENEVDDDTKCESATINAGTPAEAATEGEVTVLSNANITLTGDGTSLSGTATAVNVVTKQYVDSKFAEVPTYTAITTAEINAIFDKKQD